MFDLSIINLGGHKLSRTFGGRIARLPRIFLGVLRFLVITTQKRAVAYISVSAQLAQIYEILFLILARARRMRIVLHHHSFGYLRQRHLLMRVLVRVAGQYAMHITQSNMMGSRLQKLYDVKNTIAISNAIFLGNVEDHRRSRGILQTIGFISNIMREKGIFEFLELCEKLNKNETKITAIIAGPFQDKNTAESVMRIIDALPNVTYVGPKYGVDKEQFFSQIDVLVFPSYATETEGLVNHEAMSRSVPVIAYEQGCIPEIIGEDCGKLIKLNNDFVMEASIQIEEWRRNPDRFHQVCRAARRQYEKTTQTSEAIFDLFLEMMLES